LNGASVIEEPTRTNRGCRLVVPCSTRSSVEWVAETPRIGLWIDSSDLTIEETVNAILDHWDDAAIE
jgi:hypothetical protein